MDSQSTNNREQISSVETVEAATEMILEPIPHERSRISSDISQTISVRMPWYIDKSLVVYTTTAEEASKLILTLTSKQLIENFSAGMNWPDIGEIFAIDAFQRSDGTAEMAFIFKGPTLRGNDAEHDLRFVVNEALIQLFQNALKASSVQANNRRAVIGNLQLPDGRYLITEDFIETLPDSTNDGADTNCDELQGKSIPEVAIRTDASSFNLTVVDHESNSWEWKTDAKMSISTFREAVFEATSRAADSLMNSDRVLNAEKENIKELTQALIPIQKMTL